MTEADPSDRTPTGAEESRGGRDAVPVGPDPPMVLARGARRLRGGRVVAGGMPRRVLRLSAAGAEAIDGLLEGRPAGPGARALARRLVDAGVLTPMPAPTADRPAATVVVPVKDRAAELGRCLAALSDADPVLVVDDGSSDPAAVAAVARRHGARLLRRDRCGGPAAARNDGVGVVTTPLVAFLDSDCLAPRGWLDALAGHFADPSVVAVAPRVAPLDGGGTSTLARFTAVRSPLDLGPHPAAVRPGTSVAYVPTAALVVRRAALLAGGDLDRVPRPGAGAASSSGAHPDAASAWDPGAAAGPAPASRPGAAPTPGAAPVPAPAAAPAFDPALRFGEDVDLVWRLHDAGGRVRYDPRTVVQHAEPGSWRALLDRRYRYGTSAAPLAARHPGRLTPLVLRPGPAAVVALALVGRPRSSAGAAAVHLARLARKLHRAGAPAALALPWGGEALWRTTEATGRAAVQLAGPALLAGLAHRRTRPAAAALVVAASAGGWWPARHRIDPLRWTLAATADEAAYGLGVWRGAWRHRTTAPLLPTTRSPGEDPAPGAGG